VTDAIAEIIVADVQRLERKARPRREITGTAR
jgi:hypothetical protein